MMDKLSNKIAFRLSYLGSRYHGWQRQSNALAVQEVLETALYKTCGAPVTLSGCGRTDAGVHARIYVASCRLNTSIPLDRLPAALNSRLPPDIAVEKAVAVDGEFDARFSCVRKEYTYVIHNSRFRDPFCVDRAYFYPQALDFESMREGARQFVGRQDFAAVRSEGTPVRSTVREIFYCEPEKIRDKIELHVCADGFLYNMVRAISGTLLYCGNGKLDPCSIPEVLRSRDRERAGPTLPACGLYLTALTYGLEALDGQAR